MKDNIPKFAFFVSSLIIIVTIPFSYGVAVGKWRYFPYSFLDRVEDQAKRVLGTQDMAAHNRVFDREGAKVHEPEKSSPGMTAVTSWWESSNGPRVGMKLIDKNGQVIHEWLLDRAEVFDEGMLQRKTPLETDIQGSLLLENGEVVINLEYVGMVRMNSCGRVEWTLTEGNHHSIAQAENGSFWVPAVSEEPRMTSERYPDGYPGLQGRVWLDQILQVSEQGKVLKRVNVLDVLFENNLGRLLFQYGRPGWGDDPTHINDVEPLPSHIAGEYPLFEAGDLVVSARHINTVFVLDPTSMEVKWHVSDPFIHQHDPDFIGDGWIGVFDNNRFRGEEDGRGSRIVAFQPHTDSVRTLFEASKIERFYTPHRGKWQKTGEGTMLLTEEAAGRVIEVSSDGEPLWEWVHEAYGGKVPSVTNATRHNLTREDVASWSCSSVNSNGTSTQTE